MKRLVSSVMIISFSIFMWGSVAYADTAMSPVGLWRTIDDRTGKPKAIVRISETASGEFGGEIVRSLDPAIPPDRRCTACKDERKDQLLTGLPIIRGMKKDGSHWEGGNILDPASGEVYDCSMRLKDGGQKLVVRGFVGMSLFGRSQCLTENELSDFSGL
ncbi:DUF2147 domain-containing protein [Acetobacter fallax]|nr:DUF2147 domain-containing protein [Acetobacter fallax]